MKHPGTMQDEMPTQVYALAVVTFIVALGFGVVGPAIPLLADQFGATKTAAALAVSVFAMCRLGSAIFNGRLVDRFNERIVLAIGLFLQAVTTALAGAAPNMELLVFYRSIGGFGSAAFTVAGMSLLLRIAPASSRGRAVGIYQGGFLLGAIVGPGLGGLLAEISPRVPFFVYAIALTLASIVAMVVLRVRNDTELSQRATGAQDGQAPVEAVSPHAVSTLREALTSRPYLACLLVQFSVGWVLYGLRTSLFPVYVVEELGHTPAWIGVALLVGSLTQAVVLTRAGRLVDSRGRKPIMLIGSIVATGATGMLILPPSDTLFLVVMALLGVGGAFVGTAPAAVVADISHGKNNGRIIAVFQMSADAGASVGPLAAGVLTDTISYQAAFALGAVMMLFGVVMTALMPETGARSRRPS